jgi:cell wall-associated NlpC family hydrolase
MTTLSPTEIYNVALQAGFTPDQAVTWTAIALAESRGSTMAHNPSGEDSRGLWQINVASDVRDNPWGDLYDPLTNARAAYEISRHGTDMRPWTTTHASNQGTGADYRNYMDEARAAAGGAYLGDFSGVSGYRDPNPMGADEPTGPVPGTASPPPGAPVARAAPDADRDGASDAFEMSAGTDPHVADTDRDGLTDGFELARGANALALDTDADGLSDAYEVEIRTDLLAADTDADGLGDAAEVAAGRDAAHGVPVGPDGRPLAQGPAVDTDQDGLSDVFEGVVGTDAAVADTDADGLTDALEQAAGTDPLHVDTDRDGIVDDVDIDPLGGPGGIAGITGVPGPGAAPPTMPAPVPPFPPPPVPDPAAGDDQAVRTFLDVALAQTGDPYVWASEANVGDADPTEFDCSELAQWAAGQVGVELPDGSWLQYLELKEQGAVIPVEQAVNTPGALLFGFDREPTPGGGRPGSAHVAISLGDGTTIEARGTRYGVGSWETGDRFQYAAIIPGLDGTGGVPPAAPVAAVVAPAAPAVDTDQDGVADPYEMSAGTNPLLADSDADGLTDGFEAGHGTNALGLDSDTDGLSDVFEVQSGIDALSADSDRDGMTDAYELASLGHAADGDPGGLDPLAAVPSPGAASGGPLDADGDGLSDAWESSLGTNPLHADSDRDGIGDALEAATGTDPLLPADDPEDRPDHPEP